MHQHLRVKNRKVSLNCKYDASKYTPPSVKKESVNTLHMSLPSKRSIC